jgi:hypothetical protein
VWFAVSRTARGVQVGVTALACVITVLLLPFAFREWTAVRFTKPVIEAFAPWRALIPVGAEVLWMDVPIDAWVLLQRPVYLTVDQTGSALFSREAALEMERRDAVLARYLPEAHFMMPKTHPSVKGEITLARACASGELRFIVTRIDMRAPALAQAPENAPTFRGLTLYRCDRSNG